MMLTSGGQCKVKRVKKEEPRPRRRGKQGPCLVFFTVSRSPREEGTRETAICRGSQWVNVQHQGRMKTGHLHSHIRT